MIVVEAVRQLLGEIGIGTPGTTLFIADQNLPTDMNTVLYSLWQTGGRQGIQSHNAATLSEPWFQLVVRHGRAIEALRAAEAAWDKLSTPATAIVNRVVGDKFFLWVSPLTPPLTLSADTEQRSRVAFNIGTSVRKVPTP